ncbi:MAG: hypothetical protein F6K11_29195, partial [Leptolyngbya sp. SIO3F4]|nr:hypothetical protein [Leptolyngbya sp. SIO3F4]
GSIQSFVSSLNYSLIEENFSIKDKQGGVFSICFSPHKDSSKLMLASGGDDGTVKIWNLKGELQCTLSKHFGRVRAISFSPDAQFLASAGDDGLIILWDISNLKKGRKIRTLQEHSKTVNSISFSPDGEFIVSGSEDETVKLWNAKGDKLYTFGQHEAFALDFSPDGNTIASISYDGLLKLQSASSQDVLMTRNLPLPQTNSRYLNGTLRFDTEHTNLQYKTDLSSLGEYDLKLIHLNSVNELQSEGNSLVIVAKISKSFKNNLYHVRIFDVTGKIIFDNASNDFPPDLIGEIYTAFEMRSCDLNLMSLRDANDLPSEGNSLVIVAKISKGFNNNLYHVRIFDVTGEIIFDKASNNFPLSLIREIYTAFEMRSGGQQTKINLIPKIKLLIDQQTENNLISKIKSSLDVTFGGFCLEAWVNPAPGNSGGTIISKWREENQGEYNLRLSANKEVIFSRLSQNRQDVYELKSPLSLPSGQFTHVAASYDGRFMRLYINGRPMLWQQIVSQGYSDLETMVVIGGKTFLIEENDSEGDETILRAKKDQIFTTLDEKSYLVNKFTQQHSQITNYDLNLISLENKATLPSEGKELVAIKKNTDSYHIRIFDAGGAMAIDKRIDIEEEQDQSPSDNFLSDIQKNLLQELDKVEGFKSQQPIDQQTKVQIIRKVTSSLGHIPITVWFDGLVADAQNKALSIPDKDPTIPVLIGACFSDPQNVELPKDVVTGFFKGSIAEVRIWNTHRTEEDIQRDKSRRLLGTEPALVGYWRFEEGTDQVHNLACQNNVLSLSSGKVFNALWANATQYPALPLPFGLMFDRADTLVECFNKSSNLILQKDGGFTVESWVKHEFGDGPIIHQQGSYALLWHQQKIRIELYQKGAEIQRFETQENAPRDNSWHHIAFTLGEDFNSNKSKKVVRELEIYIDGRRFNVVALEGASKSVMAGGLYKSVGLFEDDAVESAEQEDLMFIGGDNPIFIGGKYGNDNQSFITAAIAEVRLWNRTCTQNEIKANLYRRLDAAKEEGLIGYWRLDEEIPSEPTTQIDSSQPVEADNYATVDGAQWFPIMGISDKKQPSKVRNQAKAVKNPLPKFIDAPPPESSVGEPAMIELPPTVLPEPPDTEAGNTQLEAESNQPESTNPESSDSQLEVESNQPKSTNPESSDSQLEVESNGGKTSLGLETGVNFTPDGAEGTIISKWKEGDELNRPELLDDSPELKKKE